MHWTAYTSFTLLTHLTTTTTTLKTQVPLDQLSTPAAGLFPEAEHFEVFAGQRPDEAYRCVLLG